MFIVGLPTLKRVLPCNIFLYILKAVSKVAFQAYWADLLNHCQFSHHWCLLWLREREWGHFLVHSRLGLCEIWMAPHEESKWLLCLRAHHSTLGFLTPLESVERKIASSVYSDVGLFVSLALLLDLQIIKIFLTPSFTHSLVTSLALRRQVWERWSSCWPTAWWHTSIQVRSISGWKVILLFHELF